MKNATRNQETGKLECGLFHTPEMQVEKANALIEVSEDKEMNALAANIFVLMSKVKQYRSKNTSRPVFADLMVGHIDSIIDKLEECIHEALEAGTSARLSSILKESRTNFEWYL